MAQKGEHRARRRHRRGETTRDRSRSASDWDEHARSDPVRQAHAAALRDALATDVSHGGRVELPARGTWAAGATTIAAIMAPSLKRSAIWARRQRSRRFPDRGPRVSTESVGATRHSTH